MMPIANCLNVTFALFMISVRQSEAGCSLYWSVTTKYGSDVMTQTNKQTNKQTGMEDLKLCSNA